MLATAVSASVCQPWRPEIRPPRLDGYQPTVSEQVVVSHVKDGPQVVFSVGQFTPCGVTISDVSSCRSLMSTDIKFTSLMAIG